MIRSVGDGEYIIYSEYHHPSDYICRLKINNFNKDNDKKSRKYHLKNNIWYEYRGSIEIFTDSETFATNFPHVASYDKPEIKRNIIPAIIKVEPYKKEISLLNIFFDDVGLGLN